MNAENENTEIKLETQVFMQPENQSKKYDALFVEIDKGDIKLPRFQREFVWEKEQTAKLIDSIIKGFPIGTFIFWKTKEELRSYKDIGNHKLPDTPKGDHVQYILDGQQRITSLYAIRKGIRITKDGKIIDYQDIFIDLDSDPTKDEQICVTEKVEGIQYIAVHRLLNSKISALRREFTDEILDKIEDYKNTLINYDFSTITIKDYPIEIACEVFSRINTGGKSLTVFEIMVAKTYDEQKKFDLAEQYEVLRDGSDDNKESLTQAKYETLPESVIMQCVAALTLRAVRSRDILKIPRATFVSNWEPTKSSLFSAIDFVRSELRVPVSQLLPYPAVLVPLTYFFHITKNKKPKNEQVRLLEQFFYWVGLTERYGSGSEAKLAEDINKMDLIAAGSAPTYNSLELTIDPKAIETRWFSAGNAYCKAILCLLSFQHPKSFDTNGVVILDNSNLKIASSRNYHHFFPKAYIAQSHKGSEANLIANITLIDGYSNKHRIGKKAPNNYLETFRADNSELDATLKTHLIRDIKNFGLDTNDYNLFIERRSATIAAALNVKLLSMSPLQAENFLKLLPEPT